LDAEFAAGGLPHCQRSDASMVGLFELTRHGALWENGFMKARAVSRAKAARSPSKIKKAGIELDDAELGKISGAGTRKIKFKEFTIKKEHDVSSPAFFQ
jgi:hypothetical protein